MALKLIYRLDLIKFYIDSKPWFSMREKTFKIPTPRKILERYVDLPPKIDEKFILGLIYDGVLVPVGRTYREAVKTVENLEKGKIALFHSSFRIPREDSNLGIKSLDDLVKIDSQPVLREISKDAPARLTKTFAEEHRIWPSTLLKKVMKYQDVENPPIGFYWVGGDGHVRATTWLRAITGAEMEIMKKIGDFEGEVLDKKPYGANLRVRVHSRTDDEHYKFTLSRLPMHKKGDIEQFSGWINIGHNSPDPDASYRGLEHEKREQTIYLFSASTIFAFYEAMTFVKQHPGWNQFRINPFPIPLDEKMIDYLDKLRLDSLILDDLGNKLVLKVLNKTEIDKSIGARTRMSGYSKCFRHWGQTDLSYLYQPE